MKKRFTFFVFFLLFMCVTSFSQNEEKKWTLTFGSGSVLYSPERALAVGGRYIAQLPRFSAGRYLSNSLTFVGSISSAYQDTQKYTTLDGEFRYDFGTSENTITPFLLLGGSFITAKRLTPTVNIGGGGTLWISEKLGLNGVIMYRLNEKRFSSQRSHAFGSLGLVYRFSLSGSGAGRVSSSGKRVIKDSTKRKRIWDTLN